MHADVDRGVCGEAGELSERHRTLCGLIAELSLETQELGLERGGPPALMRGQHPLTERAQGTVPSGLAPAVRFDETAGVFELAPALIGYSSKQVVDPIPPVPCADPRLSRDSEHRQRDRLPGEILGRLAQGCVCVVGGEGDEPGRAASSEVPAEELPQWNELSHLSSGLDECLECRQGHVGLVLTGRGRAGNTVEAQDRAGGA